MTHPSLPRIAAALLLALATACSSPPAPRDTFWRLDVAAPAQGFQVPPLPGVLEVARLDTDGVLSERALAYQEGGGAVQRYRYDLWSEPPGVMLQDRITQVLSAANAARRVVTPDLRVPPDYALRGKLRRFEQVAGAGKVAVEMQLGVVSARDGSLILLKTYATQVRAGAETPAAAVAALGQGVSEILDRFLADLAQASLPPARR